MFILPDKPFSNTAWKNILTFKGILTQGLFSSLLNGMKFLFPNVHINWLRLEMLCIKYDSFLKPESEELSQNVLVKIFQEYGSSKGLTNQNDVPYLMTGVLI